MAYNFTNDWFLNAAKHNWDNLVLSQRPSKIIEIGSFEGASACYLIEQLPHLVNQLEIHCIDSWEGGVEHQEHGTVETDMSDVEQRFDHNINYALEQSHVPVNFFKHKMYSDDGLLQLLSMGQKNSFDFIYVDGSHQAPDVLSDAVLAFKLLKVGGIIGFDDYNWSEYFPPNRDILRCPKIAIDHFIQVYFNKLIILPSHNYQVYIQKIID